MVREDDRSSEEEAPSKDQPQSSSDDSDLEGEMRSALKQIRKLKKKNPKLMNKLLKKDKDLQPAESENKADESKKEKAKPKKDLMPTGTRLEVKTVYSGPEDDQGRFDWTDKPPKDLGKPAEDEESSEFAFIVRRVKVYNDPRRLMELHSIVVQSPHLRRLLGKALHKYPGVTVSLERLEFEKNFEPLVHRWGTLKEMVAAETDEEAKKHAKMFIDLLETELKETMSTALDFKNNKVMSFELFWTICEPGTIIYSRQNGQEAAFKLESSQYGSMRGARVFWLSCQQLDWDGSKFGTTKINLMIRNFKGTLPIKSLSTHPIHFHPKEDELQKRLRERGALVESLAGSHYKGYTGVGWQHGSCGSKEKYNINGRVMIDTAAWNRFQPNFHVSVKAIGESNGEDDDDADEEDDDDVPYDGKMPDATEIDESCRKPLTDEQRLILAPALRGYALQQKVWVNMFPGCVEEVEFSTKAFNSLVLPSNQKELILGFTQSQQQSDEDKFDDVIKGKGRGMVILLCGAPGVGKTLTAESVAEELHAPLYMMSAAELGLEPRHVETKLQSILQMCQRWKAVLLIDEADIFLEERSLHELERNKLVSVFLRVLEYYEGILFLTTNRVQTIDDAFQSRIHISLEYPQLNADSRRSVWKSFLGIDNAPSAKTLASSKGMNGTLTPPLELTNGEAKSQDSKQVSKAVVPTIEHNLSKRDIERLAQVQVNGRQIKNIVKTARLLAKRNQSPLSYGHISTVLDVTMHLHQKMSQTDEQRTSVYS